MAAAVRTGFLRLNADAAANYDFTRMYVNNVVGASEGINQTGIYLGGLTGTLATPLRFSTYEITIPFYRDTGANKNVQTNNVTPSVSASTGMVQMYAAGVWKNTAAVTRIQLYSDTGQLIAGSIADLYGVN